jgi:hypothetical protein
MRVIELHRLPRNIKRTRSISSSSSTCSTAGGGHRGRCRARSRSRCSCSCSSGCSARHNRSVGTGRRARSRSRSGAPPSAPLRCSARLFGSRTTTRMTTGITVGIGFGIGGRTGSVRCRCCCRLRVRCGRGRGFALATGLHALRRAVTRSGRRDGCSGGSGRSSGGAREVCVEMGTGGRVVRFGVGFPVSVQIALFRVRARTGGRAGPTAAAAAPALWLVCCCDGDGCELSRVRCHRP